MFEFSMEAIMLYHAVPSGFGSPDSLTDSLLGLIQSDQKSDLALLKPTVMIIVPLILDRLFQNIK